MITRILLATLGAVAITIGLFLFMDDVANRFVLRDPTKYFAITDYIRAPDRGRQLPNVPVVPEAAPGRPGLEFESEEMRREELAPGAPEMEQVLPLGGGRPVLDEPQEIEEPQPVR